MNKIRLAVVKCGGMTSGGTEKVLQNISGYLNKKRYDVTYFYSDEVPYIGAKNKIQQVDEKRLDFLKKNGVRCIKHTLTSKDLTTATHKWRGSNFFKLFKEKNFDIILTGRAGHPEYPFTHIANTPIVDTIHLQSFPDNQYNVSRVSHICNDNARKWIRKGGDFTRVKVIYYPIPMQNIPVKNFRQEYKLEKKFVFGFHQRNDDSIFSQIPLEAYKKIETNNTAFLMLNGSKRYQDQAKHLKIKNFVHIPFLVNIEDTYTFLQTVDVYAHGRLDGEVNSQAIAEAMYFGKPIVSHLSKMNNGHVETIGNAGVVVSNSSEYAQILQKLLSNKKYYGQLSADAKKRFKDGYSVPVQMEKFEKLFEEVYKNPFPNKIIRRLYSLTNYAYIFARNVQLFVKYKKWKI